MALLDYMTDLERVAFERSLEEVFRANLEYLISRIVTPEYGGYKFMITRLDSDWEGAHRYGYNINSETHQEGGGSYESVEEATKAALRRIETLAFDNRNMFKYEIEVPELRNRAGNSAHGGIGIQDKRP